MNLNALLSWLPNNYCDCVYVNEDDGVLSVDTGELMAIQIALD